MIVVSAFWKDILREVNRTKARFISLVLITMLGAMTIVGIQAAAINMRNVADRMYKEQALYDVHIRSVAGFTGYDMDAIYNTPGVAQIMGSYSVDVYMSVAGEQRPVRTFSLPDTLNRITLVEGRLPQNYNEIAVEQRVLDDSNYRLGDRVTLSLDNAAHFHHIFQTSEFTIVGVVSSPLFITFERGRTTLGNGVIRYYAYLHPSAYLLAAYTDVYIAMEGSRDILNLSHAYNDLAQEWKQRLMATGSAEWHYFTRVDGTAFEAYFQDTLRLQQIGYVFPLVFFLVAVLVALTSMSRMVDEHRTQIGTYKALGFSSFSIALKYGLYATVSGCVGGVLGVAIGSQIFPRVIAGAYANLYSMPPIQTPIPWGISVFAVLTAVLSILIITIITCVRATSGAPAEILRPKAPKPGKRVLIERVSFIWRKLGFIEKVTARNVFRYKQRFFMTLIGVAGCTALLVTAFGVRDSLGRVAGLQYDEIVRYDAIAHTREIRYSQQRLALAALVPAELKMYSRQETTTVRTAAGQIEATLVVPEYGNLLRYFIRLTSLDGTPANMPDTGVILTEKLARDLNISIGDTTEIIMSNGDVHVVLVQDIVANYVFHFVYMPPAYYAYIFGITPYPNTLFLKGQFDRHQLLRLDDVRAIVEVYDMRRGVSNSTDALGIVTILLLVSSCALSFIVLFNLTIINLAERRRELATIKVLGFQDRETTIYLCRENLAVAVLGIILGLVGGFYLNNFVIASIEVDIIQFPRDIGLMSFVYAAVLSLVFALFVNLIAHWKLTDIDMVESLKSIE